MHLSTCTLQACSSLKAGIINIPPPLHALLSCAVLSVGAVNRCGSSYSDAAGKCAKCPSGIDAECAAGDTCYAGLPDCSVGSQGSSGATSTLLSTITAAFVEKGTLTTQTLSIAVPQHCHALLRPQLLAGICAVRFACDVSVHMCSQSLWKQLQQCSKQVQQVPRWHRWGVCVRRDLLCWLA